MTFTEAMKVFKGNYIHSALEEAFQSPVWMSRLESWMFNLSILTVQWASVLESIPAWSSVFYICSLSLLKEHTDLFYPS